MKVTMPTTKVFPERIPYLSYVEGSVPIIVSKRKGQLRRGQHQEDQEPFWHTTIWRRIHDFFV